MQTILSCLGQAERTALALRAAYEQAGYRHYRMARFEEYALYQDNRGSSALPTWTAGCWPSSRT